MNLGPRSFRPHARRALLSVALAAIAGCVGPPGLDQADTTAPNGGEQDPFHDHPIVLALAVEDVESFLDRGSRVTLVVRFEYLPWPDGAPFVAGLDFIGPVEVVAGSTSYEGRVQLEKSFGFAAEIRATQPGDYFIEGWAAVNGTSEGRGGGINGTMTRTTWRAIVAASPASREVPLPDPWPNASVRLDADPANHANLSITVITPVDAEATIRLSIVGRGEDLKPPENLTLHLGNLTYAPPDEIVWSGRAAAGVNVSWAARLAVAGDHEFRIFVYCTFRTDHFFGGSHDELFYSVENGRFSSARQE